MIGANRGTDALGELDMLLRLREWRFSERSTLLAMAATSYMGQADFRAAEDALRRIRAEASGDDSPLPPAAAAAALHFRALTLAPDALDSLVAQVRRCVRADERRHASIAASLGAGTAVMRGALQEARTLASEAALSGTELGGRHNGWRDAERASIDAAVALLTARFDEFESAVDTGVEAAKRAQNREGARRLWMLILRHAALRFDLQGETDAFAKIQTLTPGLAPLYQAGHTGIQAFVDERRGKPIRVPPEITRDAHYWGLGGVLAAAETAAAAGSTAAVRTLFDWATAATARGIVTAVDWPVLLDRVVGLLAARLGKHSVAVERFQRAIQWADAQGALVEAAIARVQLAELGEAARLRHRALKFDRIREQGLTECQEMGIDPAPFALAAARAWILAQQSGQPWELSPRQREVLRLAGEGLSQQEVGKALRIRRSTVKTHLDACFDKFGVNGTHAAVEEARRRGEI